MKPLYFRVQGLGIDVFPIQGDENPLSKLFLIIKTFFIN